MTVREVIEIAKANGYGAYMVDGYDTWGYLVTPNGNVMGICKAQWGDGITFSLKYNPSQKTGSGCSCHIKENEWDFGITDINAKTLAKLEKNGIGFAHKLKAKLWCNVDEFLEYERKFWKDRIKEVA